MRIGLNTLRRIIREEVERMGIEVHPDEAPSLGDEDIEYYSSLEDDDGFADEEAREAEEAEEDRQISNWEHQQYLRDQEELDRIERKY
jgi:hypothetical protein